MRRKKISPPEQQCKSKVSENSSGSDNAEAADKAKKKGLIPAEPCKPDHKAEEKPKSVSIDEWVYDDIR